MKRLYATLVTLSVLALGCTSTGTAPGDAPPTPRYAALAEALTQAVEHERADKGIPAVALALVEGDEIVWCTGFGHRNLAGTEPATGDTLFRVGSISKLVTALAVMQGVERGELDLDRSISEWLPEFRMDEGLPFPVTLRQLLAHRAGLPREVPRGSYFDARPVSLAETVQSFGEAPYTYRPGRRTKYSNAGLSAAGRVVEAVSAQSFEAHVQESVLSPAGMGRASFRPIGGPTPEVAEGTMWTYDGRRTPAPTFAMGIGPAANLDASARDLANFARMLLAGGLGDGGRVVEEQTLEAMWTPQWAPFGHGFQVGELDGQRLVGHEGAVYGSAARLAVLPDAGLACVVLASLDLSNAVCRRLTDFALRGMLAVASDAELPEFETTGPLSDELFESLEGQWGSETEQLTLRRRGEDLVLSVPVGGFEARLRARGQGAVIDDIHAFGLGLELDEGGKLHTRGEVYRKVQPVPPPPCHPNLREYVGEYGWDHQVLYVRENRARLEVLIEWQFYYPITAEGEDRFRFPAYGLYHGEKLQFERDPDGRLSGVRISGLHFPRRAVGPEEGSEFRIEPRLPREELAALASAAKPPQEGPKRDPDLVDLRTIPGLRFDVRYATEDNFMGMALYDTPHAYLQRPAAEALARVAASLEAQGLGLVVFDAFRPWRVTKMFWEATPEDLREFVADPSKGSRHNRGCAVDLSLVDAEGTPIEMVTGYDEFSPRAYPDYPGGSSYSRWYRDLLRREMEREGFRVYPNEWWHFDFEGWEDWPLIETVPGGE